MGCSDAPLPATVSLCALSQTLSPSSGDEWDYTQIFSEQGDGKSLKTHYRWCRTHLSCSVDLYSLFTQTSFCRLLVVIGLLHKRNCVIITVVFIRYQYCNLYSALNLRLIHCICVLHKCVRTIQDENIKAHARNLVIGYKLKALPRKFVQKVCEKSNQNVSTKTTTKEQYNQTAVIVCWGSIGLQYV